MKLSAAYLLNPHPSKTLNLGGSHHSILQICAQTKLSLVCISTYKNFIWLSSKDRMTTASFHSWYSFTFECHYEHRTVLILKTCIHLTLITQAESSVKGLSPWICFPIFCYSKGVWHATRNLFDVENSLNKCGHIALLHFMVVNAKLAISIVPHSINITALTWNKNCMLFSAAYLLHNDIKTAHFWKVVDNALASNSELAIVIILND